MTRNKTYNGRACGSLGKQLHHRKVYLIKKGLLEKEDIYLPLDEAIKKAGLEEYKNGD
jgi:hypothetical protein